jgi:ribulose-5-phosphate 4-epimerase/fuculose-1-phosphate aldolase
MMDSQIGVPLHIQHMDFMGLWNDMAFLPKWPGLPFGDEEGKIISEVLGAKKWGALLAHHGLLVGGRSVEEATYRAYFFEKAAAAQLKVNNNCFPLTCVISTAFVTFVGCDVEQTDYGGRGPF